MVTKTEATPPHIGPIHPAFSFNRRTYVVDCCIVHTVVVKSLRDVDVRSLSVSIIGTSTPLLLQLSSRPRGLLTENSDTQLPTVTSALRSRMAAAAFTAR